MLADSLISYFYFNCLSGIMAGFILMLGTLIFRYALRYMRGDAHYRRFLGQLALFVFSLMLSVTADNLWLLLTVWSLNHFLLIRLMVHKPNWQAAKNAGAYAATILSLSTFCLCIGFAFLAAGTGETSLHRVIQFNHPSTAVMLGLIFVSIACMIQSAIWPFQRWLLSSLNSPTPVSAMMHAGFINGGVLLIVRLAPLYWQYPVLLNILFSIGLLTAIIGTLFKLIQQDVKRMLACSTMAQMGFALLQCGLGLFPLALAHLCWHGFFKSNLFLSSPSALHENKLLTTKLPQRMQILLAFVFGSFGTFAFFQAVQQSLTWETQFVFTTIIFITATQLSLSILLNTVKQGLLLALITVLSSAYLYGLSVALFETIMSPLHLLQPQQMNTLQCIGLVILATTWLLFIFRHACLSANPAWWQRFYVSLLNASQPHPQTVTAQRNHYQY